jgi:phage baseplate assembly protein V
VSDDNIFRSALERIGRRVITAIAVGRKTTGRDDGNVQYLQARLGADEIRDDLPRLAEFGFTSMPPDGSDLVVLYVGGDRSNGVVIASGHIATRMTNLAPGESALYDALGKHVYLKKDGLEIDAKGQPVTIVNASDITATASGNLTFNIGGTVTVNAAAVQINCNVGVDGQVDVTGDAIAAGISLDHHVHGGVKAGGDNTAGPQ